MGRGTGGLARMGANVTARSSPDVGKLIGRQGRTIQAMRTIATIAGDRVGKKVTLEVLD